MNTENRNVAEENLKNFNMLNNAILKACEISGITKAQGYKFFETLCNNLEEIK
jgi:hypothetical protein